MYIWRNMTAIQREDTLRERQLRGVPFHGPPHYGSDVPCLYHLTAACYEHRAILGASPVRMAAFEAGLVAALGGDAGEPPEGVTTNAIQEVQSAIINHQSKIENSLGFRP